MKIENAIHDYYKIGEILDTEKFGLITVEGYIQFTKPNGSNPIYFPFTTYDDKKYLVTEKGGLMELLNTNEAKMIME